MEPVGPPKEQVPGGGVAGAPEAVRLGGGTHRQCCHGDISEPTGPERPLGLGCIDGSVARVTRNREAPGMGCIDGPVGTVTLAREAPGSGLY